MRIQHWLKITFFLLALTAFLSVSDARSSRSNNVVTAPDLTTRSWSLYDLGLRTPVKLYYKNHERHLFFRVPDGIKLSKASFEVHATFHAPFPATTAVNFSLNGEPVTVYALSNNKTVPLFPKEARQEIVVSVPLKDIKAIGGFIDLGIEISSQIESDHCLEERGTGNEFVIDNKATRFVYHFRAGDINNVRAMVSSLPSNPAILISKHNFNAEKYETALRISMALSDLNFQPRFVVIPEVGDSISTSNLIVPSSTKRKVRNYESFRGLIRAINNKESYILNSSGEVAAWLYLQSIQDNGLAQIIIDPESVRSDLDYAFSGWTSLATWMQGNNNNLWLGGKTDPAANNWITMLGQQPALVVESNNIRETARMLTNLWLGIANGSVLTVSKAETILRQGDHSIFTTNTASGMEDHYNFNMVPVINVESTSSWILPFRLANIPYGKRPESLYLNLIAAPNGDDIDPVASVLLNENLLTAVKVRTDGRVTRLRVNLPLFAIQNDNKLRIEIRRRYDSQHHCTSLEQSYPVQILPSSYMKLESFNQTSQFFMLAPLLSSGSDVIIPSVFISQPATSLPYVSQVLHALSVSSSTFTLVETSDNSFSQSHPFISFGILPDSGDNLAAASAGQLIVKGKDGHILFDTNGLGSQSIAQVVDTGSTSGIFIRQVTNTLPVFESPLFFARGDFAVLDESGVKVAINLDDSEQAKLLEQPNQESEAFIDRYIGWIWIVAIIFGLLILIMISRWFFRRRSSDTQA